MRSREHYQIKNTIDFDQSYDTFIGMAGDLEVWRNGDDDFTNSVNSDPVWGYVLCDPLDLAMMNAPSTGSTFSYSGFIIEDGNIRMTQDFVNVTLPHLVEIYNLLAAAGEL